MIINDKEIILAMKMNVNKVKGAESKTDSEIEAFSKKLRDIDPKFSGFKNLVEVIFDENMINNAFYALFASDYKYGVLE
jgi:hypothetical protein